jgi:hypothetical protein
MRCEKCGFKIRGANHKNGKHHGSKHPGNKATNRRNAREAAYNTMIARGSRESKVDQRMNTGGYHCPGSNK